jgi:uncharacterized pyridoxamine 5'-phosphate oxidase family protein
MDKNLQQILDFLSGKVFYLATVDGQEARVRPMGFIMDWEGQLAFCTSNAKEMYRQMKANPNVQISAVDEKNNTLRLTGKAAFITTEAAQKKALEVMPSLAGIYAVGDGKFEVFTIDVDSAYLATMGNERTVLV